MVRRLGCVLALVALGAAPGAARAATVTLKQFPGDGAPKGGTPPHGELAFEAEPGERNVVTFGGTPGAAVVRDAGAPLVAGTGCEASGPGEVTCHGTITLLSADLLDGDDSVDASVQTVPLSADGGDGSDVLRGGAGNDLLRGGLGDDVLDGGAGADRAYYDEHTAPVTIALDGSSPSGAAGESDALRDMEHATGGRGDDTITGNALQNSLAGGAGDDRIRGGAGDDHLDGALGSDDLDGGEGDDSAFGGPGPDTVAGGEGDDAIGGETGVDLLDAGAGDDTVQLDGDDRTRRGERAACGDGQDVVSAPDGAEVVDPDCERIELTVRGIDLEPVLLGLPLRIVRGGLAARVTCSAIDGGDRCTDIRVSATADARTLRGRVALLRPGASRTVRLAGRRTGRGVPIRVRVHAVQHEDGDRDRLSASFFTTLP